MHPGAGPVIFSRPTTILPPFPLQTRTFAHHLDELVRGLDAASTNEILAKYIQSGQNIAIAEEDKKRFASTLFGIQAYLSRVDEAQAKLAKDLGLTVLFEPGELATLLTAFRYAPNSATLRGDHSFWKLFHSSSALLHLNALIQRELVKPKEKVHADGNAILSLEIIDYDQDGVTLQRLSGILGDLAELYGAVDQFLGRHTSPHVAYTDSGSDISIGLEGVKETIDAVGDLFTRAWNALRFRKHEEFERTLDSTAKGIAFLANLKAQQAAGAVDGETALKLEIAVKRKMTDLVGAGVMIERTDNTEHYDRRALLTAVRDQKLLGPATGPSGADSLPPPV